MPSLSSRPQSTYFSPAFASGSRMLYMSRPSTPDASFSRFAPSLASRAAAASASSAPRPPARDHAVVVGDDRVARIDQRARADDGNVDRAERRLHRALGADALAPDREAHLGQRLHVAHARVDDQRPRAARLERGRQQVAEIAVGAFGGDRRDDDVAGLDLLGDHVHHPVVAGMQQHGHRRPETCAPA